MKNKMISLKALPTLTVWVGILLLLCACSKEENTYNIFLDGGKAVSKAPRWEVAENKTLVYEWKVDEKTHSILYNMTMIGVIDDLQPGDLQDHSKDSVGFFAENECVGITSPKLYDGKWYFMATIYSPVNFNTPITVAYKQSSASVTYYWPHIINYANNDVKGEISDPYLLNISEAQTYPEKITVNSVMPDVFVENLAPGDEAAIFCGDECRGVLEFSGNRVKGTAMMLHTEEDLCFKYYSATTKRIYTSLAYTTAVGDIVIYYDPIEFK